MLLTSSFKQICWENVKTKKILIHCMKSRNFVLNTMCLYFQYFLSKSELENELRPPVVLPALFTLVQNYNLLPNKAHQQLCAVTNF